MKIIDIAALIAAAATVAVSGTAASAADLYGGSPRGGGYGAPVLSSSAGNCYFRGDVGYSGGSAPNSASWPVSDQTNDYNNTPSPVTTTYAYAGDAVTSTSMSNSWFGGVGLGCGSVSRGIRGEIMLDQTGYRNFTGTPLPAMTTNINVPVGGPASTSYIDPLHTTLRSTTLMFNGYKDFGSFGPVTPYLGAGVGVAYNTMGDVSVTGNPNYVSTIQGDSKVSLAWSLMAGIGYQITPRAVLDLGYRYMDYGKAQSGMVDSSGYTNNPIVRINDVKAHEFKVGLRYQFGGDVETSYQPLK